MGVGGLLEINTDQLCFTFELKKQSSCSVELVNRTDNYVAFKVKTTSPKRYCVRPNTGVILPRETYGFTVTMQALRSAPPDMQLKDKFLVQGTIVPIGTKDEDIVHGFFSKESGRHIEEHKLRVVLVSPSNSPVLQPINGAFKQEPAYETSIQKEAPIQKEALISKEASILKEVAVLKEALSSEEEHISKEAPISKESSVPEESPIISNEQPLAEDEKTHPSHVAKDVEDLKLKLLNIEMKLSEADEAINTLTDEKMMAIQKIEKLRQEIVVLGRRGPARVQVGFPFFFVVFMALVGLVLGYLLHP